MAIFVAVRTETNTESCKDLLQGYLTGQVSSVQATYQVEALKREFKSFTSLIEESMKTFIIKEKVQGDIRMKGRTPKHISIYTKIILI